jgi:formiminotetrahydrofolate cyclodeaminase
MRNDTGVSEIAETTIGSFLTSLAAREPAPGGGAAAALHAAQGAALVAMAAHYSDRGEDTEAIVLAERIAGEADALRVRATELIAADMQAFAAVARSYGLPKSDDAEKAARREAIAAASIGAAVPPAAVIELAGRVVALARELHTVANRNVITDIAAAADAARAAASTARINVEINLGGITDTAAKAGFEAALGAVEAILSDADGLSAQVRAGLA